MKMKKKVTILLKEMMEALASMAKAKSMSLSLQTRISVLKLRLTVFSLLRDRRLQAGPISNHLHSLLNRRRHHRRNHHQQQHRLEQKQQQARQIRDGEVQFDDGKMSDALVLFYCDDDGKSEPSVLCDVGKSDASVVCDGAESVAGASDLAEAAADRVADTRPEEEEEEQNPGSEEWLEAEEEANPVSDEWLEAAAVATAAELEEENLEAEDAQKVLDELEFVVDGGDDAAAAANKVFDEIEFVVEGDGDGDGDDDETDLANKVFDEIEPAVVEEEDAGGGGGGGWVGLLRKSKAVEEEEFKLEDKIDEVADLFIKRFHEQMRMERSPIHH